jgi:1-deoxy-D-xylulose-5-phosphate reductoisomerase
MTRIGVAVLGSTGSIGQSTLAVLDRLRDRFEVVALTAHRNVAALAEQVARFRPRVAVVREPGNPLPVAGATEWRTGGDAIVEVAVRDDVALVVNALVGAAGLEPTVRALEAGKRVALANKESLVIGGPLVRAARARGGGTLVPVDSEHSALFQCLEGRDRRDVRRLVLTASGGAFRDRDPTTLDTVAPEEALRHPTWEMGAKVTVDSATLANKAMEVMEAHELFEIPLHAIDVVLHRESVVHGLVEFVDGSCLAHLSVPTMELPILYALVYPERVAYPAARLDLAALGALRFEPLAPGRYPMFDLGLAAARQGGAARVVYNAANEVAVAAFLEGRLPFPGIARCVAAALERVPPGPVDTLEAVLAYDREARARTTDLLAEVAARC